MAFLGQVVKLVHDLARQGHDRLGIDHLEEARQQRPAHLVVVNQGLGDFFAFAQAGIDDLDILTGLEPIQADQALGQVADLDRLAHFEDVKTGFVPRCPGIGHGRRQHQHDGFGNGHEITLGIGVGQGDRAAAFDLRLEQRHDRAGRAQHIAETHDAGLVRIGNLRADQVFGQALGRPHQRRRRHRLVR